MAKRSSKRPSAASRLKKDGDAKTDEGRAGKRSGRRPGRAEREPRATRRLSAKKGRKAAPPEEDAEAPVEEAEAAEEQNAKAPPSDRSSRRDRREERGSRRSRKRRSKRRSGRGENGGSETIEDRRARAAAEAEKRKKRMVIYMVGGGVLLVLLMIFAGPLQRMYLFHKLSSGNERDISSAIDDLLAWKETVRPGLVSVVKNESGDWPDASRAGAACGLVRLHLPSADAALVELAGAGAKDPDEDQKKMRRWVLAALVSIEENRPEEDVIDPERFPPRIFAQNTDSLNPQLRLWATKGLGYCKGEDAVEALLAMLRDPDDSVRSAATTSFTRAAEPSDTIKLIDFLNSDRQERRDVARAIFKHFDNPTTIAVLGRALENASDEVILTILDIYKGFNAYGGMSEPVEQRIAHPSMRVRIKALEVAGYKRLDGTETAIRKAAADDLPEVRVAVAKAVEAFDKKDLAEAVHPLLHDDEKTVRDAAIKAIASLEDRSATEDLVKLLSHEDQATTAAAVNAIRTLFPLSAKKFGVQARTWQKWWTYYNNQKTFVDYIQKRRQKIIDLLGNQDNKSYKRVLEIIATDSKFVDKFLSGEFHDDEGKDQPVVPELKAKYGAMLKDLRGSMNKWKYDAQKLQTN